MIKTKILPQAIVHKPEFNLNDVEFDLSQNRSGINKPVKALWSSTYREPVENISWVNWCISENFYDKNKSVLYKITPKKDFEAKIYTIFTKNDYLSLLLPKCSVNGIGNFIDYKALKNEGYHGLRITERGAMLGHTFSMDFEIASKLSTFDCESTV